MYSVVMMMALSGGGDAVEHGRRGGCDGCQGGAPVVVASGCSGGNGHGCRGGLFGGLFGGGHGRGHGCNGAAVASGCNGGGHGCNGGGLFGGGLFHRRNHGCNGGGCNGGAPVASCGCCGGVAVAPAGCGGGAPAVIVPSEVPPAAPMPAAPKAEKTTLAPYAAPAVARGNVVMPARIGTAAPVVYGQPVAIYTTRR